MNVSLVIDILFSRFRLLLRYKRDDPNFWSYLHAKCVECGTTETKHKSRGLCQNCKENKTYKTDKVRRAAIKLAVKNRKDSLGPVNKEVNAKYCKKYYDKNREVFKVLAKGRYRKKSGGKYMVLNIQGKEVYLPFETLEKPNTLTNTGFKEWQENQKKFDLILDYYNKQKGKN